MGQRPSESVTYDANLPTGRKAHDGINLKADDVPLPPTQEEYGELQHGVTFDNDTYTKRSLDGISNEAREILADVEMAFASETLEDDDDGNAIETTDRGDLEDEVLFSTPLSGRITYRFPKPDHGSPAEMDQAGAPRAEPSRPGDASNGRWHVDARPLEGGRSLVVSGFAITCAGKTTITSVTTKIVRQRPDVAALMAATRLIRSRRAGDVTVAFTSGDLPKALVQPWRRFHAAMYFRLVMELHEAARVCTKTVRIMGPLMLPMALENALDRAEARERLATTAPARPLRAAGKGILTTDASRCTRDRDRRKYRNHHTHVPARPQKPTE